MAFSPHHTSHIITSHHITHHKPKEENTKKKFLGRVLGPDGSPHHISPDHTSQAERREHEEEVLGPSSWAGWLTTPHLTRSHITSRKKRTQRRSSWAEFLGRMAHHTTSHHITHHKPKEEKTKKKFLGRVLGPDGILTTSHIITSHHIRHHKPKVRKSTSFIVKTSFKSIPEQRKVRELPRKMNIEEVEEPKKYENYHAKPVSDPFKSIAEHRKVRELPRKMNIEDVEEPETTKIHRQNPRPTTAATRKVRK